MQPDHAHNNIDYTYVRASTILNDKSTKAGYFISVTVQYIANALLILGASSLLIPCQLVLMLKLDYRWMN